MSICNQDELISREVSGGTAVWLHNHTHNMDTSLTHFSLYLCCFNLKNQSQLKEQQHCQNWKLLFHTLSSCQKYLYLYWLSYFGSSVSNYTQHPFIIPGPSKYYLQNTSIWKCFLVILLALVLFTLWNWMYL